MQYGKFASVYDRLMSDVDYDSWADYVLSFTDPGSLLLECACGTGEITKRIASKGCTVIATDSSEEMLRVASEKLRLCGAVNRMVHFAQMDMRKISVHKPVDCVLSCCDGVNYLLSRNDVKRFFSSAYSALKPKGLLLFDISSRHKLSKTLGQNCFVNNDELTPYMWQNMYDEQTKLIRMELSFFVKQDRLYERFDETHIQRAHSIKEIMSWLSDCGFTAEAYNCFSREEPSEDAERIQFAARKL